MTELPDIINWRRRDSRITLSGQPTEAQFEDIRNLGVARVINLGPHSNDGALKDEAGTLRSLEIEYIYIPVDFENPTETDYAEFCRALEDASEAHIHIHCIYNARVSAFMLRRARDGLGGDVDAAAALMEGIWRPGGVWARFLGDASRIDQPNTYKGYEY